MEALQLDDLASLLVEKVIGDLVGQRDPGGRVGPLQDVEADLAKGAERRVLERGPHAGALAVRAGHVADLLDVGFLALAGELHHPELGDARDLGPGPIEAERLLEGLLDLGDVLAVLHVDEVDDDEPPEVAKPQLPGDLLGRLQIRAVGGFLHVAAVRGPARVDVDGDHRLRGVDDEVAAALELRPFLVDGVELGLQVVAVEQRRLVLVERDHLDVAGGDRVDVGAHLPERLHVVDQDLLRSPS